ncbi:hypothetical protein DW1_1120 [Proteiniborus sp. DW1]|uniref:3D domain-containing protein n=1 Tax=Proteiniborus sp. DW1 TaxID=1889883 RepID=UPI00092E059B|nr:hypothetical protein DW1_1120 [Proteiniborus sp. DW1]
MREIKDDSFGVLITIFIIILLALALVYALADEYKAEMKVYEAELQKQSETIKSLETKNAQLEEKLNSVTNDNELLNQLLRDFVKEFQKTKEEQPSRGSLVRKNLGEFMVTAYDLSVESCGKPIGHKEYGITASGFNLTGHTWETAKTIAVDPKVIPLGSKVRVTFTDEKYSKYNGEYIARDTGGAVKGKIIDLFLGDFSSNEESQKVRDFGRTKAIVEIIKSDKE